MAQLKDLIVNGPSRFIGDVYATTFTGNLAGNANTATSATTAAALTGKTLVTASTVTTSNYPTYVSNHIPTMSFMAYWNGAYSGTSSNLTYCKQGTIIGSSNIGSQSVNYATSSGSCSGNAATATKAGYLDTGTMTLYANGGNEINFGGTNTSSIIYFGYRATGSKPVPTSFVFGGSGTATLTAGGFKKKDSSASYVLTGDGGHAAISSLSVNYANSSGSCSGNAATATNADKLDGYNALQVLTANYSDTADLNKISVPSIYRLSTQNPNLPSSIFSYGNLLTIKYPTSDTVWQLIGSYSSDVLCFRRGTWYADGTGTLSTNAWKTIAFTDSNISGNAATATNADKLDGVHYQNILERQYSGSGSSGTATGWFRIAETLTNDGGGITFLLAIQRTYHYTNNECYLFSISISFSGGISITQLSGYANIRLITKIRVDRANSKIAYIDLYIDSSTTNNNYFWYTVGCAKSYTTWIANPTLMGYAHEFTTVQGCKSDRGFTGDLTGNASSATNADKLDGYHAQIGHNKPWGTIPVITKGGWMDVGRQFEFHYDNTTGSDYSTMLRCTGNYNNVIDLPSASGTLALTTDNVASASKLQNPRTIWGQSFDGTGNVSGGMGAVSYIEMSYSTPFIDFHYNNSTDDFTSRIIEGLSGQLTVTGKLRVGLDCTTSTDYAFYVNGDGYFVDNVITEGDFSSRGDAIIDGHAKVNSLKASNICIECDNSGNTVGHTSEINNYSRPLYIQYSTSNNCCICYGGGNVGIGITSPTYKLHVSGDARIDGTISCIKLSQTSDIKYKTNIKQIEYEEALKIIENLNPVTWDWNENTIATGSSSGFVAQEAEEFIPNAISRDNENNLSLDYTQLHSYEIKVIQEQQKEIIKLKEKLKILEKLIS